MSDLNEKELCELEDRHWAFMNPDNEHFHNSEWPEYAAFEIRKLRQRIAALEAALERADDGWMPIESARCTIVFECDLRKLHANPMLMDTPFGRPVIAGVGDTFKERDELEQKLEAVIRELVELEDIKDQAAPEDMAEYAERKPLAWAAARQFLARQGAE